LFRTSIRNGIRTFTSFKEAEACSICGMAAEDMMPVVQVAGVEWLVTIT
jgi:hypothetical protein